MVRMSGRFVTYKEALKFKNHIMFSKKGLNPRISKHKQGWEVTYEN